MIDPFGGKISSIRVQLDAAKRVQILNSTKYCKTIVKGKGVAVAVAVILTYIIFNYNPSSNLRLLLSRSYLRYLPMVDFLFK